MMSSAKTSPAQSYYSQQDEDDPAMMAPLVGGTRQRRPVGGDVFYASQPSQPNTSSRLESATRGGLGPKQQNIDDNDDEKKIKGHQTNNNVCVACLRYCGCSYHQAKQQEGPDGLYYRDDFNDAPRSCRFGTTDEDGIWMNMSDQAGTIMAVLVWFLLGYSALTITFLAQTGGIPVILSMWYCILCCLALACHAKTTLTDPGSVPVSAVPTEAQRRFQKLSMCSQCQTFKPPFSHHCRICNRCISRMDHHCPWMNNCIGAGNMKHFLLFLIYTWTCSVFSLCLLGWNYFFCASEDCTFTVVLVQLVRVMTMLSMGAFLFTSSMLMNVCYGLMTGIGTIDRLKKKATNTMQESMEEPIHLKDIFGIAGFHTWPFPIDPVFEDYDRVMGYSTPQRLLREQMKENPQTDAAASVPAIDSYLGGGSVASHSYLPV